MSDPFGDALDRTEDAQAEYGRQLGFVDGRTPFTAESLPHSDVGVKVNEGLMDEVASHILNRAGHVSIIDERGAGKSHFRDLVYDALSDRDERFRVARIREVESITTRRLYTRVLDELKTVDDGLLDIPDQYPHPTDEVRVVVEDVGSQLEAAGLTGIVQVDQMEDVAGRTRRFDQLLAGLQSVGDLGDAEPAFILFLFGTPRAGARIDELRETLASRLVAKNRRLERFGFNETDELISRWLAWARDELAGYDSSYPSDPFAPGAIEAIVTRSDQTPREVRQQCYHAYRAGARQYDAGEGVEITVSTIENYV